MINVGEVVEIKTQFEELIFVDFAFSMWIELGQYAAVFAQDVVDIAHKVVGIAVQPGVVCRSALVGAKLFIGPPLEGFLAFQALLFHIDELYCRP